MTGEKPNSETKNTITEVRLGGVQVVGLVMKKKREKFLQVTSAFSVKKEAEIKALRRGWMLEV